MASTSTRPEFASTSSSSLPPQDYDVFLSFRGEDIRKGFTDHLYSALVRHRITTFRDDDELQRGEAIGPELLKSIERSSISIIIFSRNYADSRWCLDELVKILECRRTFKQIVLPVFYEIDPSDVRAQRGSFAEAFSKHGDRYKGTGMEGKVEMWRAALTEAANLSGYDLQNMANGHESKFIEKIVEDIWTRLNHQHLHVANHPVGMESRVQHVKNLLRLESDDVRIIGIWGMGGLGKTTIAKALYNRILPYYNFEGSSFLANVREISKQPNGPVRLQEQLLSDILMNSNRNVSNVVDQGIEVIKRRVWSCRRVFVVLDDVDDLEQLKALAINRDWFRSGSRIIVTTRYQSSLNLLKVDALYRPQLLGHDESLQLFSWHAFGKDHPVEDYVGLSEEVTGYAGGLPLVLEILGSFLSDKTISEWKSALEKLRVIPNDAILAKLRISFDPLSEEQKELFLDIACFFVEMDQNYTIERLEWCYSFLEIDLSVLSRRCLVTIESGRLMMHDMLRDMGREIARREHREDPGKCRNLWFQKDVLDVLENNTGTEAVRSLVLNLPKQKDIQVNAFAKMKRLRLLQLNNVRLIGSYKHLSKKLIWLCWSGFPLKYIPSNFFLEKVVVMDLSYSCLKHVWEGMKNLSNLKFLNLSHSHDLIETPDFSGVTNLKTLLLNDCVKLEEVHKSIECLNKLVFLELKNCGNLKKLPLGIGKLTSLQDLCLSGCSKLEEFPGFEASLVRNPDSISHSQASTQGLVSLTSLDMQNCNLSYVPDAIGSLIKLEWLKLSGNENLRELPLGIWNLTSLQFLFLERCPKFEKFAGFKGSSATSRFSPMRNPDRHSSVSAQGLISLNELHITDCNLLYIPDELESSISLKKLDISGNKNLGKLPLSISKSTSLQDLNLSGYSSMYMVPRHKLKERSQSISPLSICFSEASEMGNPNSISLPSASMQGLISLRYFDLSYRNLSHLPDELWSLNSLIQLDLRGNNFCTLPASINRLSQLRRLYLHGCTRLQSLPASINRLSQLQRLHLSGCTRLQSLPARINRLSQLEFLFLTHCTRLQSLPELPVNLKLLDAHNCTSLERISIRSGFSKNPLLNFSSCHSLKIERSFLLNKELSAVGEFSIILPGGEVPDHFKYQNEGSVLSFVVSLLPDRKIRGWVLCAVIAGSKDGEADEQDSDWGWLLNYEVKNETKCFQTKYMLTGPTDPPYRGDHLWLHYVPQLGKNLQMEDGDEVEYSVHSDREIGHPYFQLKNCGVNLIYEVDNQKDYQSNDQASNDPICLPSCRDVTLYKDDLANQLVVDNEGRECARMATCLAAARGTTGKRKHDDSNESSGHKKKNPGFLPFFNVSTQVDEDNDMSDDCHESSSR